MAEPGKVAKGGSAVSRSASGRTKSIEDIARQVNRIWIGLGENSNGRMETTRKAYLRYQRNMLNSPTMQRAMKSAGVNSEQDRQMFLSSFGAGMQVQVPQSQYMRRRNNRRG